MCDIATVLGASLAAVVMGGATPVIGFSAAPERVIATIVVSSDLKFPFGIAIAPSGEIVLSHDGRMVSRIDEKGKVHRVAGGAIQGFAGDGDLAVHALLFGPGKAAFDRHGDLFIPDMVNHRIRKIDYPSGVISTVVGHGPVGRGAGSFGGDGGAGLDAFLNRPISVAFDSRGALYVADAANSRVRKVSAGEDGIITGATDEIITTVAGIGKRGFTRDHDLAITARLTAVDLAIDSADHLFLADAGNNRIRRVDRDTGMITTIVGSGPIGEVAGYSGNGVAATQARMSSPEGIVFDADGNLYIADVLNHRVRMVTPGVDKLITGHVDEMITTLVGSGTIGTSGGGFEGDGGPALEAKLNRPQDVAIDADGNMVIVDGLNHRLRRVILNPMAIMPIDAPHDAAPASRGRESAAIYGTVGDCFTAPLFETGLLQHS